MAAVGHALYLEWAFVAHPNKEAAPVHGEVPGDCQEEGGILSWGNTQKVAPN